MQMERLRLQIMDRDLANGTHISSVKTSRERLTSSGQLGIGEDLGISGFSNNQKRGAGSSSVASKNDERRPGTSKPATRRNAADRMAVDHSSDDEVLLKSGQADASFARTRPVKAPKDDTTSKPAPKRKKPLTGSQAESGRASEEVIDLLSPTPPAPAKPKPRRREREVSENPASQTSTTSKTKPKPTPKPFPLSPKKPSSKPATKAPESKPRKKTMRVPTTDEESASEVNTGSQVKPFPMSPPSKKRPKDANSAAPKLAPFPMSQPTRRESPASSCSSAGRASSLGRTSETVSEDGDTVMRKASE